MDTASKSFEKERKKMSIKKRQWDRKEEEVIREELQAGRFPDLNRIHSRVMKAFVNRPLGKTRYRKYIPKPNEVSSPEAYNEMFETLREDLEVGFLEIKEQYNGLRQSFSMYETEKRSIAKRLKKLEREYLAIKSRERTASSGWFQETFHTFEYIDFDGDESQGIDATDVFIDLRKNEATLQGTPAFSTRHQLKDASVTISLRELEGVKQEASEKRPFKECLGGAIDEAWMYEITKDSPGPSTVTIDIKLKDAVAANQFSLEFQSIKPITVGLSLLTANKGWKTLSSQETYEHAEWCFQEEVEGIKLTLTKTENDRTDGSSYLYGFGIREISLIHNAFKKRNIFVSKPVRVTGDAHEIQFTAQNATPPKTSIAHYIGIDNEEGMVEWQEVKSGESLLLKQRISSEEILDPANGKYGTQVAEQFGVPFYSAGELSRTPIPGTVKLYTGEYMWKQETVEIGNMSEEYYPTLKDWVEIRDAKVEFIPIEDTLFPTKRSLTAGSIQRFTTHAYFDKAEETFNIQLDTGNAYTLVYLNQNRLSPVLIKQGDKEQHVYNYRFQKGWNRIEILTYATAEEPFEPNLYFKDIGAVVNAEREPLKQVTTYDLLHNTSLNDMHFFSIDGKDVWVNYNPALLNGVSKEIKYRIQYEYLPDGDHLDTSVRVMSMLERDDDHPYASPVLKGYQLLMK
jgi:hypothetical protein